jgi:hypothetical protein
MKIVGVYVWVAQLVEQWTENPCVSGSSPLLDKSNLVDFWVYIYDVDVWFSCCRINV